ncbi:phosphonate C-P lyase system protein PhnG [Phyllobacterium sp. 0TCS1.6C]|uniref:phosphonate C-P lyase system protein PhnG n=1 Tax=unclassified Phyllobacterium TaxID=2638441 RepID=UPI00226527A3|nr:MULTISPECIES: phosphonate C-P lyase system protein PhnG [unclassified Phyllobacterium]MCX8279441.1 phosphonate C-P lyase system protein PhnG [Phyllobacterium sp. 0TCS1.6C]MCX8292368.1 phosphonate C-P lyase system protein PhnG [Phyllobacterium sp. 0TCS1.6A]
MKNPDVQKAKAAPDLARKSAMALLAQATRIELEERWDAWPAKPSIEELRRPETGLVMLRGRIGGGGAPFNLGEATVTRATVRLGTGMVGHAYALGRDREKVRLAAVFDALWQTPEARDAVEASVLRPIARRLDEDQSRRTSEAAATKVDFFTMVRGDD